MPTLHLSIYRWCTSALCITALCIFARGRMLMHERKTVLTPVSFANRLRNKNMHEMENLVHKHK